MNSKKKIFFTILSALLVCSFSLTVNAAEAVPISAPVPPQAVVAAEPIVPACVPILAYNGTGDSVLQNVAIPAGAYKVTLTHDGTRNFIVKFHNATSTYPNLLANAIGAYNGTVILDSGDLIAKQGMIEVKADGNWTITISTIANLSTTSMTGTGDKVTGLVVTAATDNVLTLLHTGKSNFIVWSHSSDNKRDLIANTIGEYNGQTVFKTEANKTYYFDIKADGDWLLTFGVDPNITTVTN